jgi:hypothetical protein
MEYEKEKEKNEKMRQRSRRRRKRVVNEGYEKIMEKENKGSRR